jgi:3'(2'),5'-bisphosphate nucleotidase
MDITKELLDELCAIAEEAGAAIMEIYETDFSSVTKSDQSPLTMADLRADAIIRSRLEQNFPDIFILSEESQSISSTGDGAVFFLVDPLDGTKEFIRRNGEFTVNIALIKQGIAVAGVVYAPALDQMFYAGRGHGAWRRSNDVVTKIAVASWDGLTPLRVIGSRSHGGDEMEQWLKTLPCDHLLVTAGSSLKFCLVAAGLADIYPRLAPTAQWDTAAAQCIVEQAGGSVMSIDHDALTYGRDKSILNRSFVAKGLGIERLLF